MVLTPGTIWGAYVGLEIDPNNPTYALSENCTHFGLMWSHSSVFLAQGDYAQMVLNGQLVWFLTSLFPFPIQISRSRRLKRLERPGHTLARIIYTYVNFYITQFNCNQGP